MLYLTQAMFYTAVMLLIYWLFLRNRPIYQFSRVYLLASAVLPLVIPFIEMPPAMQQQVQKVVPASFYLPEFTLNAAGKVAAIPLAISSFWYWYGIVALLFIASQLLNAFRLWKVVCESKKEKYGAYTLVTHSCYGPGSIGKYILFPEEEVNETILAHEQAHIRLHHTRDLIFLNVLQAVLWPNVLLFWIKREIKEVHEFQADALVNPDREEYVQLLLNSVFNTRFVSVMHSFIVHPVKRRLMMLGKKGKGAPAKAAIQVFVALAFSFVAQQASRLA